MIEVEKEKADLTAEEVTLVVDGEDKNEGMPDREDLTKEAREKTCTSTTPRVPFSEVEVDASTESLSSRLE